MNAKFKMVIRILKSRIPVREGTKVYAGFETLRSCDGKTYAEFRSQAGGAKGSGARRFSPSTVWRLAEAEGFAVLENCSTPCVSKSPSTQRPCSSMETNPKNDRHSSSEVRAQAALQNMSLNARRELIVAEGVDLSRPGIYAWEIQGTGLYVGKYTRKSRPLREYDKNVRRLLSGQPYRPQNPYGFRRIHHALAEALVTGRQITLHILENCASDELGIRERLLIKRLASGGLNV